jgi:hypothetical protein
MTGTKRLDERKPFSYRKVVIKPVTKEKFHGHEERDGLKGRRQCAQHSRCGRDARDRGRQRRTAYKATGTCDGSGAEGWPGLSTKPQLIIHTEPWHAPRAPWLKLYLHTPIKYRIVLLPYFSARLSLQLRHKGYRTHIAG